MRDRFEEIYRTNEWGHGSGEGSLPVHTKGYVKFINRFLKQHNIQSVVDMGCGDWQFSRFIDWRSADYKGYDIVEPVVIFNQKHFTKDHIHFFHYSGNPKELPAADLFIAKDVLQHWSNDAIVRFLPLLSQYKYVLLTNCINPEGHTENQDIDDGAFRTLDLNLPPFSICAEEIFTFTNKQSVVEKYLKKRPVRWLKKTLLIKN